MATYQLLRHRSGNPSSRWQRTAAAAAAVAALLLGAGAAAAPSSAASTDSDGVLRSETLGSLEGVGDTTPFVLDLNLTVESLTGDYGVSDEAKQTTVTVSADVLFAFDKADLTPAARAKLADVVAEMRTGQASGQVVVGGHADHLGDAGYNEALSLRRAQAAVAGLQPLLSGVDVALVARGFGSSQPQVKEAKPDGSDDPAARARNRRVTITFSHPAR